MVQDFRDSVYKLAEWTQSDSRVPVLERCQGLLCAQRFISSILFSTFLEILVRTILRLQCYGHHNSCSLSDPPQITVRVPR